MAWDRYALKITAKMAILALGIVIILSGGAAYLLGYFIVGYAAAGLSGTLREKKKKE